MSKSVNVQEIGLTDGRRVCVSYGVVVAAYIPGRGYLQTDKRFSVTTSKHMNQFTRKQATEVPHAELLTLVQPVESSR